ncbi:LOW QUALITY PROTEIN: conserved hypothetical protein, partial [Streptomyces pristinaespiralis ATCC 25486]
MSLAASYAPAPLAGCVVLVVDGTTGIGRAITARLCAAGAAVAVVGAGHPGRGDDAATNAAFLCKELAGIGHVALPYQVDAEDTEAVAGLPGQISADIGPVSASIVVVPSVRRVRPARGDLPRRLVRRRPGPAGGRTAHRGRPGRPSRRARRTVRRPAGPFRGGAAGRGTEPHPGPQTVRL